MSLDTQQQILIEQRIANDAKSTVIAYLLLLFLGYFGAHRFYLGATGSAATMLVLFVVGIFTAAIGVGLLLLGIVGIWAIVDLFLIPGMITKHKQAMRQELSLQFAAAGNATRS